MWVRVPPRVPMRATAKRVCPNLNTHRRGPQNEDREIRTPNLLIWSQTRYRCAISPVLNRARRHTSDTAINKCLNTTRPVQHNNPHVGFHKERSNYKPGSQPQGCSNAGSGCSLQPHGSNKPRLGNNKCASCGVRTHAQLPALDLKSNPLTTRANWH